MRAPLLVLATPLVLSALLWGDHGHTISGRAAALNLPAGMPAFFRNAVAQLQYLNPEPDRWRVDGQTEMNEAFRYDHYLNFEAVPTGALNERDRFEFLAALHQANVNEPERVVGLLPFQIMELTQRLETEFRLWRAEPANSARKRWIEQRIINDAGILGHFVTDGANPHHTSIHHNGWADGVANPNNFTMDRTFHTRFETQFVGAQVRVTDLLGGINPNPRFLDDTRAEVLNYLRQSHDRLSELYRIEQSAPFRATTTTTRHKQFAIERLSAGVHMLRDIWWTAWVKSGTN